MINLINAINGNIRNSKRLPQLHNICSILNIPIIEPIPLCINNSWFTGFFDADGTIGYSFKRDYPQLTISVTNKKLSDVQPFKDIFGGNIYFDKAQNGYYKWSIQGREDILNFIYLGGPLGLPTVFINKYIKFNPSRTKFNKLMLSYKFYSWGSDKSGPRILTFNSGSPRGPPRVPGKDSWVNLLWIKRY